MNKPSITIREATRADVARLVEMNRDAYPVLAEEDVVWGERHLISHQRLFPQGQLVAEIGGKVVGAVATLVVDLGPNPLRHHTWPGITDSGYFTNHDPQADTLYGADVYVDPNHHGQGVGAALYEARRQLCRRLNKRRILAGGRLWNYHEHASRMSPEEYAERVAAGELKDKVLSFQLREDFTLRGVMPHYFTGSDEPQPREPRRVAQPGLPASARKRPQGARRVRAISDAQSGKLRGVRAPDQLLRGRRGRVQGRLRALARARLGAALVARAERDSRWKGSAGWPATKRSSRS